MNHQDYMESIGQTTIFDFLEITPTSKRNRSFIEGDKVLIRYYEDEVAYVRSVRPQLLEVADIINKVHDFYQLKLSDGSIVEVTGEKLKLIEGAKKND